MIRPTLAAFFLLAILLQVAQAQWTDEALKCYEASADPDLQIELCTRAIDNGKLSKDVLSSTYYNRGLAWRGKDNFERAVADFDAAIKTDPKALPAYYELRGLSLSKMGEYGRAIADFDYLLRINPQNKSILLERGTAYGLAGEYGRAIADFDAVIKLEPRDDTALTRRGAAWSGRGNFDKAVSDFDAALQLNKWNVMALQGRGDVRFYQGEMKQAADDFARVQVQRPNPHMALWLYVARARVGNGDIQALISSTKKLGTAWPQPIVELMRDSHTPEAVLAKMGKPEPKLQAGEPCQANFYIGQWFLIKKQQEEASRYLREAQGKCDKFSREHQAAVQELGRFTQ